MSMLFLSACSFFFGVHVFFPVDVRNTGAAAGQFGPPKFGNWTRLYDFSFFDFFGVANLFWLYFFLAGPLFMSIRFREATRKVMY